MNLEVEIRGLRERCDILEVAVGSLEDGFRVVKDHVVELKRDFLRERMANDAFENRQSKLERWAEEGGEL